MEIWRACKCVTLQGKLSIMKSMGPGNFVTSDILLYQLSINNTKQRKLFHWDQRKYFIIHVSGILLYKGPIA